VLCRGGRQVGRCACGFALAFGRVEPTRPQRRVRMGHPAGVCQAATAASDGVGAGVHELCE
jgi:hypothetical protein